MVGLELELSASQIEALRRLACLHYGDAEAGSLGRVVEAALEMRLRWLDLAAKGGEVLEEPRVAWEAVADGKGQASGGVRDWLFDERRPR